MADRKEVLEGLKKRGLRTGVQSTVDGISWGLTGLDRMFKSHGIPRGRITQVVAKQNHGKCLVAGTYVWTDCGLETIEEVFARIGLKATCTSRVSHLEEGNLSLVNEYGEMEGVTTAFNNNRLRVLKVTLESGRSVTATMNHPLRVMNRQGWIVWKTVGSLEEGDVLVSATFGVPDETQFSDEISEDEAEFLGYIIADACLTQPNRVLYSKTFGDVRERFTELASRLYGMTPKTYDDASMHLNSKALREHLFEKFGIGLEAAAGKEVPLLVRRGGQKIIRAYLRGYLEADFYLDPSGTAEIVSASSRMMEQIQLLLLGVGVPSTISAKIVPGYEQPYYRLYIGPSAVNRLLEFMGVSSERRQAQAEARTPGVGSSVRHENIPYLYDMVASLAATLEPKTILSEAFNHLKTVECSRDRLRRIIRLAEDGWINPSAAPIVAYLRFLENAGYTYERITSIEEGGLQPTFDFCLPETHSFLANGILSHNSTLVMTAAGNLHTDVAAGRVKRGNILFIDMEKTFEASHALGMGIDIDDEERFLYIDPEDGYKAIDAMEKLIDTKSFDMVILDSVTMMIPRAMLEKEPDKSLPALQARQNSDMVRRLVGRLHYTNTAMVIINHLTGTMAQDRYGNPILQPGGGELLQAQSSALLWLQRAGKVVNEKGDDLSKADMNDGVAHEVTIRIEKNKLGRQQYQIPGRIPFGEGFDAVYDLCQTAVDVGTVSKAGAWIKWGSDGELGKWNGDQKFYEALREDVELYQAMRAAVLQDAF